MEHNPSIATLATTASSGDRRKNRTQKKRRGRNGRQPTNTIIADIKAGFLDQILKWDFFDLDNLGVANLRNLPKAYIAGTYSKFLMPHLLEECRASICRDIETMTFQGFPILTSPVKNAKLSRWCTMKMRSGALTKKDEGYANHLVFKSKNVDFHPFLTHDLVLMIPIEHCMIKLPEFEGKTFPQVKDLLKKNHSKSMGLIAHSGNDSLSGTIEISNPPEPPQTPNARDSGSIHAWMVYKITSIVTALREFEAMHLSAVSPCFKFLMEPSEQEYLNPPSPTEAQRKLYDEVAQNEKLNSSQASAVRKALPPVEEGVALIQGPPGTGKTKTLLALVAQKLIDQIRPLSLEKLREPDEDGLIRLEKCLRPDQSKILVCAHSNAAVDEIAERFLTDGITVNGKRFLPKCLRVGQVDRITREKVKLISMSTLLENLTKLLAPIREKLRKAEKEVTDLQQVLNSLNLKDNFSQKDHTSYDEPSVRERIKQQKKILKTANAEIKIVTNAHYPYADVYFSTLTASGSQMLKDLSFDLVIVDEAAQAVELSTMIPLRRRVSRLVLVGDPKQLAATVISDEVIKLQYARSLFERLMTCGVPVNLLETQYRMRPQISAFPSRHFYSNQLRDHISTATRPVLKCKNRAFETLLGTRRFFNLSVSNEQRNPITKSWYNPLEAAFVVQLICFAAEQLCTVESNDLSFPKDIAVIMPYREQVEQVKKLLEGPAKKFLKKFCKESQIDVSTIDAFQGSERRIVIFSCVRSQPLKKKRKNIGFLSDIRRMNVALTRARDALWIVGNQSTLSSDPTWRALIESCEEEVVNLDPRAVTTQPKPWPKTFLGIPRLVKPGSDAEHLFLSCSTMTVAAA